MLGDGPEVDVMSVRLPSEAAIIAEMEREGVNRLIAIRRIQSRQALKARAQACRRGMTSCH